MDRVQYFWLSIILYIKLDISLLLSCFELLTLASVALFSGFQRALSLAKTGSVFVILACVFAIRLLQQHCVGIFSPVCFVMYALAKLFGHHFWVSSLVVPEAQTGRPAFRVRYDLPARVVLWAFVAAWSAGSFLFLVQDTYKSCLAFVPDYSANYVLLLAAASYVCVFAHLSYETLRFFQGGRYVSSGQRLFYSIHLGGFTTMLVLGVLISSTRTELSFVLLAMALDLLVESVSAIVMLGRKLFWMQEEEAEAQAWAAGVAQAEANPQPPAQAVQCN